MEPTISLAASAVAALGHLAFGLAAVRPRRAVPLAFARLAFALSAWSAALMLEELLAGARVRPIAWTVAQAIPPLGLALAARLGGASPRLERAARVAWLPAALMAAAILGLGWPVVPWAAAVLFPGLAVMLVSIHRAHRSRGTSARGVLLAGAATVAAALVDTFQPFGALPLPRLAALASLALVATLASSVARHGLFEVAPAIGRVATLAVAALGVAFALAEGLTHLESSWARALLASLALLAFALAQPPLVRSLRSLAARARGRRRRELVRRMARLDSVLVRATGLRELRRGLRDALAADPEVESARLELGRGRRPREPAEGALPLVALGRRVGTLHVRWREPRIARNASVQRALRGLATRTAVAAGALREQARRERTERLAELGALAAAIAHEIKNPLGAILGAVDLLEPRSESEAGDARRWIEVIRQESRRLDRVVSDALALGRAPRVEAAPIDLRSLLEQVRMLAAERAAGAGVELAAGAREADGSIECDVDQVRHALLNLVLNAIASQPGGGRVELTARRERGGVALRVRDDGPGIPPRLRARIFEPFFTTRSGGSGLGLAVAQRVAVAHGGRLDLEEPPHGEPERPPPPERPQMRGACFVLWLPAHPAGAETAGRAGADRA